MRPVWRQDIPAGANDQHTGAACHWVGDAPNNAPLDVRAAQERTLCRPGARAVFGSYEGARPSYVHRDAPPDDFHRTGPACEEAAPRASGHDEAIAIPPRRWKCVC